MNLFKCRASAIGQIMGQKGLGKTGISYIDTWAKQQVYSRTKEFSNKYTEKGNKVENDAIDFICEQLDLGFLVKNDKSFEDDYFTGTLDVITKTLLIDNKSSYDCFTFPLYEKELPNKDYYGQGQIYMHLTGIHRFCVAYTLMDTPIEIIEKEAYWWCKNNGYDDLDMDVFDQFLTKMTYRDIPAELKIKTFYFDYDPEYIEKAQSRVIECKEYIEENFKLNY